MYCFQGIYTTKLDKAVLYSISCTLILKVDLHILLLWSCFSHSCDTVHFPGISHSNQNCSELYKADITFLVRVEFAHARISTNYYSITASSVAYLLWTSSLSRQGKWCVVINSPMWITGTCSSWHQTAHKNDKPSCIFSIFPLLLPI